MHLQRNTTLLFYHFYHSQWFDTFYNVHFQCANYLCIFQCFQLFKQCFSQSVVFLTIFAVLLVFFFISSYFWLLHSTFSMFECFSWKNSLCFSTINRNLFRLKNVSYHFWHRISIFGHLHSWHFVQLIWKIFNEKKRRTKTNRNKNLITVFLHICIWKKKKQNVKWARYIPVIINICVNPWQGHWMLIFFTFAQMLE